MEFCVLVLVGCVVVVEVDCEYEYWCECVLFDYD